MSTVVASPSTSIAENGMGGAGTGAPSGPMIRWDAQVPTILSPLTAAGAPIVVTSP